MHTAALTTAAQQARALVRDALADAVPVLSGCSREELVTFIGAAQQLMGTVTAAQQQALAHLSAIDDVRDQSGVWTEQHRGLGHTDIGAPGDVAGVMGLSETAAGNRIDDAIHQITITPQIHAAVAAGDLDQWRAHVITTELAACPEDIAFKVAEHVVEYYDRRGGWVDSAGPLRSRVRRLILKHAPETITDQATQAVADRTVRRWAATEGCDHWQADLPVETSLPMWRAIDTLAGKLRVNDTELTLDQARADALAALVLGRAEVTVHLHATTPEPAQRSAQPLITTTQADQHSSQADQHSGQVIEVGGLGPQPVIVDLDTLAQHTNLIRSTGLRCDPGTGAIVGGYVPTGLAHSKPHDINSRPDGGAERASGLASDRDSTQSRESNRTVTTYAIPADIARLVRLRDGHCRFPGCTINARFCDLDHVIAWPVGPTTPANLMALCRRHHRVKHKPTWHVRLTEAGLAEWTTPTRQTRTTHPIDHLRRFSMHSSLLPAPSPSTPTPADSARPFSEQPHQSTGEHQLARTLELHGIHQTGDRPVTPRRDEPTKPATPKPREDTEPPF